MERQPTISGFFRARDVDNQGSLPPLQEPQGQRVVKWTHTAFIKTGHWFPKGDNGQAQGRCRNCGIVCAEDTMMQVHCDRNYTSQFKPQEQQQSVITQPVSNESAELGHGTDSGVGVKSEPNVVASA